MHIAEVQVFGSPGTRARVGRVTELTCGNLVTAVTLGPVPDPSYVHLLVIFSLGALVAGLAATSFVSQRYPHASTRWGLPSKGSLAPA
jgi:hypothetical protein